VAIALLFVVRIYFAYRRAALPFEIDYEEGNVLDAAVRMLQHQTPYSPPGSFPYAVHPYGPIGYLLTLLGIRVFGVSLFGPRILVLLSGVLVAVLVEVLIRHYAREAHIGWLFGLLFLCSPIMWNWYPLVRVDLWAILLSLCGIYIFVALRRWRTISSIFFVAAILTKPTAMAAPLACTLEFAIEGRWRQVCAYLLLLVSLSGVCTLWIGPNFWFAMLSTHPDPYSFGRAARLYWSAFQAVLVPMVILLLALFSGFRWNPNSRLILIYAAAVSLFSLTSGKLGSETNHFLEWTAVVCILAGLALSHLFKTQNLLASPLLAGSALLAGLFSFLPQKVLAPGHTQSECVEAYQFIKSFPGDRILSEDLSALILAGKPVLVGNPFVITQLGQRVPWSHGSPTEMVKRREFDLIALGGEVRNFDPQSGRWSPLLMQEIDREYQLQRRFLCHPNLGAVYVPQRDNSTQRAAEPP